MAVPPTLSVYDRFLVVAVLHGMWHPSSPTRDRTRTLSMEAPGPNHWTARKVRVCIL